MQISNDQETTRTNRQKNTLLAQFPRQNLLILIAVMLGSLVIGDAFRDALDPKMRGHQAG